MSAQGHAGTHSSGNDQTVGWKPAVVHGRSKGERVVALPATGAVSGKEFGAGYLLKLPMAQKHLTKGPRYFLLGGSPKNGV